MKQWISYGADKHINVLNPRELDIITSFRMAAMAGKAGYDPSKYVAARLGSKTLARKLALLVSLIGDAWPDSFALSRPCCARMTYDEVTLVGMLRASAADDRAGFDELLSDMLAQEPRDFFYGLFSRFSVETKIP